MRNSVVLPVPLAPVTSSARPGSTRRLSDEKRRTNAAPRGQVDRFEHGRVGHAGRTSAVRAGWDRPWPEERSISRVIIAEGAFCPGRRRQGLIPRKVPESGGNPGTAGLVQRWAGAPRWLTGLAIVALFLFVQHFGVNDLPIFGKLEAIAYDARLLADATAHQRSAGRHRRHRRGEPAARRPLSVVARPAGTARRASCWTATRRARSDSTCSSRSATRRAASRVLRAACADGLANVPGYLSAISGLRAQARLRRSLRRGDARARRRCWRYTFNDRRSRPPACCRRLRSREADLGRHVIPIAPESGYTANQGELQRAAAAAGHIDPVYDSDGVVRRVPLVKRYAERLLSRAGVGGRAGRRRGQVHQAACSIPTAISISLDLGGLKVPVAKDGTALVPYRGKQKTFPYYSAASVMAGEVPADKFRGRDRARRHHGEGPAGCALDAGGAGLPRRGDPREPARGHPERRTAVGARGHARTSRRC